MATTTQRRPFILVLLGAIGKILLGILPVAALAGVSWLLLNGPAVGLQIGLREIPGDVNIVSTILRHGEIELNLHNLTSEDVTISTVNISDSIVPFEISPSPTIPPNGEAVIHVPYPWVNGQAYEVIVLTSDAHEITTAIQAASQTPLTSSMTQQDLILIGLTAGFIPLLAGIIWFGIFKRIGRGAFLFLMAIAAGLLAYVAITLTSHALVNAAQLGETFQGVGAIGIGIVVTFLFLDSVERWRSNTGPESIRQHRSRAWKMALEMGWRNFAEGLAVGASIALGAAALSVILIVVLIIQNIIEGFRIASSVSGDRLSVLLLLVIAIAAGAPAVLGTWLGGINTLPALSILFLAFGAGAVLQATFEGFKLIQRDSSGSYRPFTVFSGVTVGMLVLYITGQLIK